MLLSFQEPTLTTTPCSGCEIWRDLSMVRNAIKILPLALGSGAIVLAFAQSVAVPALTHPYVLNVPPSLPPPPLAPGNPLTVEGVALGQRLFNEKKLSGNNTQACSSCH
ncbi:cytochrome c peroxidase, partial [Glaesserella parasuis]|uniref:cytochrome c peroxidase n=1 Tax=Glaesserella parasuis TaxID=738 RepID=UPI003F40DC15